MSWPPQRPKAVALTAVLIALVAGLVTIVVQDADAAYLGSLLIGCTALGTVLATALDRRRS